MFLRKIVDWIITPDEDEADEVEDTSNEWNGGDRDGGDKDVKESFSSHRAVSETSLGAGTSILDFCLVPEKDTSFGTENATKVSDSLTSINYPNFGSIDTLDFVSEPKRNPADEIKCSENIREEIVREDDRESLVTTIQVERKSEAEVKEFLCTAYPEQERHSPASIGSGPLISEADTANVGECSSPIRLLAVSSDTPKPSFSCGTEHKQLSDVEEKKPVRNIFTQTEYKRRHSSLTTSLTKNPHKYIQEAEINEKKHCPLAAPKPSTRKLQNSLPYDRMINYSRREFDSVVYGTLFILGCNGTVPDHLAGQMNCKFVLRQRYKANGVKEAFSFTNRDNAPPRLSPDEHSVTYKLSASHSVVVSFIRDKSTDMFQIGRYDKSPIDLKVLDVNIGGRARNGVSRFACRIIVQRHGRREARIYAAAFDASGNIFLGEGAVTCGRQGKMDGFTTNGVLLMHPVEDQPGVWREVSVCGFLYPLRCPKIEAKKRSRIMDETNVLQDGTLIDLCGVTLLWRTPDGLQKSPDEEYLKKVQLWFHNSAPECQVLSPKSINLNSKFKRLSKPAYVYLSCGHVTAFNHYNEPQDLNGWSCPVCRCISSIAVLEVGKEPGFYMGSGFPTHAFRPCGHVASMQTVLYWSSVKVPDHRNMQEGLCPFCGTKLHFMTKYVKLVLPEILDGESRSSFSDISLK